MDFSNLFKTPTIGLVIIAISTLGYISNYINGQYLRGPVVRALYYIGAFVHETSHALVALCMGAKVVEYTVFSRQPRVVYVRPKVRIIGDALIAIAPIFGGLGFLFLLNAFVLHHALSVGNVHNWSDVPKMVLEFFTHFNIRAWESWVLLVLCLNSGSMLGPSLQDLKNVWIILLVLVFIPWAWLTSIGFIAIGLIAANIVVQAVLVLVVYLVRAVKKR